MAMVGGGVKVQLVFTSSLGVSKKIPSSFASSISLPCILSNSLSSHNQQSHHSNNCIDAVKHIEHFIQVHLSSIRTIGGKGTQGEGEDFLIIKYGTL